MKPNYNEIAKNFPMPLHQLPVNLSTRKTYEAECTARQRAIEKAWADEAFSTFYVTRELFDLAFNKAMDDCSSQGWDEVYEKITDLLIFAEECYALRDA